MDVLVTGATGFVGRHTAEALAARGHRVRCLVRPPTDPRSLAAAGFEVLRGHLLDQAARAAAVAGADAVVHVAGMIAARSFHEMRRANVEGAGRIAASCRRVPAPPRRFVLVSSLAAAGPSLRDVPMREDEPPRPVSRYGLSKLLGERAVARALPLATERVVIRPPAVYGPRDRGILPFFQAAARGIRPRIGTRPRRLSLVSGIDLADAIRRAVEAPAAAGRTYFVADAESYELSDVLRRIGAAGGTRGRVVPLPEAVVRLVGVLAEEVAHARGQVPLFSRDKVREFLAPGWECDASRARSELGWAPARTLDAGLAETAAWYREAGWL